MKYIIFDFDGTIADTYPVAKEIFKKIKDKYSDKDFDFDDIRKYELDDLLKKYNFPKYNLLLLLNDLKKELQKDIEKIKLFQDMNNLIKELRKNYRIGIISSNSEKNVLRFLEKNNLKDYFEFVYTGTSLFGKDYTLNKICKKYSIDKNQAIYIGDETRDIKACKKAGIEIIAVTWGFSSKELLEKQKPDYIAECPEDILKIIKLK